MKFDKTVNKLIQDLVLQEGRMPKSSKFSSISVDSNKLSEKVNAGDFDVLLKSWAGNSRYGNVSEEELSNTLSNVSSNIETYQPSSLGELNSAISSVVDDLYKAKGPRRKTFTDRLTKAITNLILHKEYDLVSVGSGIASSRQEMEGEEEGDEEGSYSKFADKAKDYDIEGLSSIQSAVYEFIKQADNPTTKEELETQFPGNMHVANDLVQKGLVKRDGDSFEVVSGSQDIPVLDIEDEEEEEDPFEVDPDAKFTFKQTFGDTRNDEGEWDEWDRDQVPSWLR